MSQSLKPEELSVILSGKREFRLNLSEEIATLLWLNPLFTLSEPFQIHRGYFKGALLHFLESCMTSRNTKAVVGSHFCTLGWLLSSETAVFSHLWLFIWFLTRQCFIQLLFMSQSWIFPREASKYLCPNSCSAPHYLKWAPHAEFPLKATETPVKDAAFSV